MVNKYFTKCDLVQAIESKTGATVTGIKAVYHHHENELTQGRKNLYYGTFEGFNGSLFLGSATVQDCTSVLFNSLEGDFTNFQGYHIILDKVVDYQVLDQIEVIEEIQGFTMSAQDTDGSPLENLVISLLPERGESYESINLGVGRKVIDLPPGTYTLNDNAYIEGVQSVYNRMSSRTIEILDNGHLDVIFTAGGY